MKRKRRRDLLGITQDNKGGKKTPSARDYVFKRSYGGTGYDESDSDENE
jgi:hypothetical protein